MEYFPYPFSNICCVDWRHALRHPSISPNEALHKLTICDDLWFHFRLSMRDVLPAANDVGCLIRGEN